MRKTLLAGVFVLLTASSAAQISAVTDSAGNELDFERFGEANGTVTYGGNGSYYGRVTRQVELANNSEFQICVRGSEGYRFSAIMGGSQSYHSENLGIDALKDRDCFSWNVSSRYVYDGKRMIFTFWGSDRDSNTTTGQGSRGDTVINLRYENVTVEADSGDDRGLADGISGWVKTLLEVSDL